MVRARTRDSWHSVAPHDPPGGDVDHADHEVVFLCDDDLSSVRREERVVWNLERLAGSQVPRARKDPANTTLRIDDEEAAVRPIGDEDRPR